MSTAGPDVVEQRRGVRRHQPTFSAATVAPAPPSDGSPSRNDSTSGWPASRRAHRLAERAGALAVHEAHVGESGHERVVQILLDQVARLVGGARRAACSSGLTPAPHRARRRVSRRRAPLGAPSAAPSPDAAAASGTRTRQRCPDRTVAVSPAIATISPSQPEMLGGDGHAGHERRRRRRASGAGGGRHAGADLLQPPAALLERRPRALGALEALPLGARPRDGSSVRSAVASALARSTSVCGRARSASGLGLARGGQARGRLRSRGARSRACAPPRCGCARRAARAARTRARLLASDGSAARAMSSGAEPEPRGDGERVALAGAVVDEAEGGRERGGVELDGGVARARMRAREGRAAARGAWWPRRARRASASSSRIACASAAPSSGSVPAPSSSRSTSELRVGLVQHLADLLDEGREGGEVLRHRLVVADDRVERARRRAGARPRRPGRGSRPGP